MSETRPYLKVPMADAAGCLGPEGSASHVARVLRMLAGRWKLPILFRLFANPAMRNSQLLRELPSISQKMLTQHLRELEQDGLIARQDFQSSPPHVEYLMTTAGRDLMPILMAARDFSRRHPPGSDPYGTAV